MKSQKEDFNIDLIFDAWTIPTKISIINFLVYYNKKIVFHRSIYTSTQHHDAICKLLNTVIEDIKPKYSV